MGEKPRGTDSRRTLHSRIGGPVYRCREAEEEEERGGQKGPRVWGGGGEGG